MQGRKVWTSCEQFSESKALASIVAFALWAMEAVTVLNACAYASD
jgi:hypothetical protein